MTVRAAVRVDRGRIERLTHREAVRLEERTARSGRLYERAARALAAGVPSAYQAREPWPIYIERGAGSRVWDVDGNEYVDLHNGFGAMVHGHAHPAISAAIARRAALGTHFAAPTEDAIWVAEELTRRWGLPLWRFTNSGTEATMDAIRIARALTGRDTILKVFGSYHGHHDAVMVSIGVDYADIPAGEDLASLPYGAGIPDDIVGLTVTVPFNDADALERRVERLAAEGRPPACLIMEAALMNLGIVLPKAGYLARVREITRRHGLVWIVDEVKTGLTIAAGGATEAFALSPDLVTVAKALGAGLPSGAVGGTDEAMRNVADGTVHQVGTFNGNPLVMAAARAGLAEVLTPAAYEHLGRLNERMLAGCRTVLEETGLPGYAVGIGAKGVVTFSPVEVVDYASFKAHQDVALTELAWLYALNRGIFMTPGREEEWTLSVAHTDADVDRYVEVFAELARELTSAAV